MNGKLIKWSYMMPHIHKDIYKSMLEDFNNLACNNVLIHFIMCIITWVFFSLPVLWKQPSTFYSNWLHWRQCKWNVIFNIGSVENISNGSWLILVFHGIKTSENWHQCSWGPDIRKQYLYFSSDDSFPVHALRLNIKPILCDKDVLASWQIHVHRNYFSISSFIFFFTSECSLAGDHLSWRPLLDCFKGVRSSQNFTV